MRGAQDAAAHDDRIPVTTESEKERAVNSFWEFIWIVIGSFLLVAYLMMLFHIFADIFRDDT